MFRCGLLATTAFVVVGTLSFLAVQSAAVAGPVKVGAARDRNNEFLQTYRGHAHACGKGYFSISGFASFESSYTFIGGSQYAAFPVSGTGKTVDRILVQDGYEHGYSSGRFSVGIYSNAPSGVPGKRIAGGTGIARRNCGKVFVSMPPTSLARGTKYWIEENTPVSYSFPHSDHLFWRAATHSRRKTYVQSRVWNRGPYSSNSYTSPWQELSGAPFFRLDYQ